jgi:hypothetical protein
VPPAVLGQYHIWGALFMRSVTSFLRSVTPVLTLPVLLANAGTAVASPGHSARAGSVRTHVVPLDDTTSSLDNLRTGWDPNEPGLSPSVVHGSGFGEVFRTQVDGQVYAQPLVVGSTLIVATENDYVYGLNAATGAVKWRFSIGSPYRMPSNCPNIYPYVGITSTPVYDPSTGSVYVMGDTVAGTLNAWRLYGINVSNGAQTFEREMYGNPSNDSHIHLVGTQQLQRASLLLLNGWVYAAFSSHCDHNPYAGYVADVNVANRDFHLWTDESGATDNRAGIWQSGGGLVSDGPNRIFLTSGNGISPAKGPGNHPPGQLAESVIRLARNSNGTLSAQDFFSPADASYLDANDLDYGSAGPAELPVGTSAYPHVIVQDGKIGHLFLLNADNLGGREQGPGGSDDDLYQNQATYGVWGHPAIFEQSTSAIPPDSSGTSDYVLYVGRDDYLKEFEVSTNGSGVPSLTDVAKNTFTFNYGSGSPVITSNGTDPSTGVVWVVHDLRPKTSLLDAFALAPQSGQLQELASEPIGNASKFTTVATSNGMVYVGTGGDSFSTSSANYVYGFGVTTGAALTRGATPAFADTAVGSSTTRTVTATASRTVTVTGLGAPSSASPSPFTISSVTETGPGAKPVPVSFPVILHRGDTLKARVKFAPTAPGGVTGALSFRTAAGQDVPVNVPLIAAGTRTGLYATAPSVTMLLSLNDGTNVGPVPVGLPNFANDMIVNGGTTPERITKVSVPGAPFTVRDLPKVGTVVRPGQSVLLQFVYTPTRAVKSTSALTVTAGGSTTTISLTGYSTPGVSKFTAPSIVSFGSVTVGHTATRYIHILNAGNQGATVSGTRLTGPFRATAQVATGLPVNPSYDLAIPVTFTPSATGYSTGQYTLSWTDRFGPHSIVIGITGTGVR